MARCASRACSATSPTPSGDAIRSTALPALAELAAIEWDRGNEYFPPTSFQISNVHAGTGANNVIPGGLEVLFNFRFSPESGGGPQGARARGARSHGLEYERGVEPLGQPVHDGRGAGIDASSARCRRHGVTPALSTSGGTSDGRFLAAIAREVVEFGPVGASIHGIDEHVRVADIAPLSMIYERAIAALLTSN